MPVPYNLGEFNLQGTFCYYHEEFPMVLEFLRTKALPVEELITSRIKLGNIVKEGFEALTTPSNAEIKIIVQPDE
ncbi:hypothetical protein ACFLTJ_02905 [Chloroflexota bacterium]